MPPPPPPQGLKREEMAAEYREISVTRWRKMSVDQMRDFGSFEINIDGEYFGTLIIPAPGTRGFIQERARQTAIRSNSVLPKEQRLAIMDAHQVVVDARREAALAEQEDLAEAEAAVEYALATAETGSGT